MPGLGKVNLQNMIDKSHMVYYSGTLSKQEFEQEKELINFGVFLSYNQLTPTLVKELCHKKVVAAAGGYAFSVCVTGKTNRNKNGLHFSSFSSRN
jgi:hypothetical protein